MLGIGLLLATACRDRAPGSAETPAPSPRRDTLSAFLASYSVLPAAAGAGSAPQLGTRWSSAGSRAVWLDRPAAPPELPEPSRAIAQLGPDSGLAQAGGALWLLAPGSSRRAPGGAAAPLPRLLAAGPGGAWFAAATGAEGERLVWIDTLGRWHERATLPPGLDARVATADGARVALVRSSGADGTLLFLHESATASTRLLLPADRPGRFDPIEFSGDGARLLLISDDLSERARLEWLDLESGERSPLSSTACTAVAAHLRGDGALAISSSCAGRAELRLIEAGAERLLPAPADARPVEAWPDGDRGWLYAVASARQPRDLWRVGAGDDARPVVYGLGPRIDPADLVAPEPIELATADGAVPAELWLPRGGARTRPVGAVVWIDRDEGPVRWFEFEPMIQFLAQHGVAVLRLRLPGADGFGRAFRERVVNDPGALLDGAVDRLTARFEPGAGRIALVAEGPRPAALAIALSARSSRFAALAALGATAGALDSRSGAAAAPLLVILPPAERGVEGEPETIAPTPLPGITRLEVAADPARTMSLAPGVATALWRHLVTCFEGGSAGSG